MRRVWIALVLSALPTLAAAADRPSIILITVDTVRADRMGFLGSQQGLTPNLDALARQAVVFERAYSQAPLTPVSHATILSGTYPSFHGVRDFGSRLPESVPYLPALLRAWGYHTAAFVSSIILDPQNGFAPGFERGFDTYDAGFHRKKRGEARLGSMQRRGEDTVARALAWLQRNRQAPVFLWVHIWDAHDPYDPPSSFKERFPSAPYDACVSYVDDTVGKFLASLRSLGIYDDALIGVMSDHGESLGEHGENTHGVFLYDSTIRVPLLIKFPQGSFAAQRVSARVSLVDVTPTVLSASRTSVPPEVQGQSLLSQLGSKIAPKPLADRVSIAESEYSRRGFGWSSLEALRAGNFLYVKAPQPELYNQAEDPAEKRNLYQTNKLAAAKLSVQLATLLKQAGANAPQTSQPALDQKSIEKLSALGYVASSGKSMPASTIDPKTHIQVANDLHDADLQIEDGRQIGAIPLLEHVVATDPQIPHAQYFLGVAYKESGQYDKAIVHLDQAIRLVPDSMMGHYEIALALYAKGQLPTAATHLEIVVQHSPDWTDARFSLAAIYARTDRIPEALANLDATLQLDPEHYRANLLRGRILYLKGDAADGLSNLEKAARVEPKSVEAHQFLSEAYAKVGQEQDAAREHAEAERLRSSAGPTANP